MQVALDASNGRGLALFARGRGRNYMMRSEKRPTSYYSGSGNNNRRRRRTPRRHPIYAFFTLLFSVLIWPIGMFMLWAKKLRWGASVKILVSLITLVAFCGWIYAGLTMPTNDEKFQRFQTNAQNALTQGMDAVVDAGSYVADESTVAFGAMSEFHKDMSVYAAHQLAEGAEATNEFTNWAREGISETVAKISRRLHTTPNPDLASLPPETTEGAEASVLPTLSAATDKPGATPTTVADVSAKPSAKPTATPRPTTTATAKSTEKPAAMGTAATTPKATATAKPTSTATPRTTARPTTTAKPTAAPTAVSEKTANPKPTASPTAKPTAAPTTQSTAKATTAPTVKATAAATKQAASPEEKGVASFAGGLIARIGANVMTAATAEPTSEPTVVATTTPTVAPTARPTATPTPEPTPVPTPVPTAPPTVAPTATPTAVPTPEPSPTPNQTPVPAPEGAPAPASTLELQADATPLPTLKPAGEATVYHTTNGRSYHMHESCVGMSNAKPYTLASSIADGFGRCGNCLPPATDILDQENVVWCDAAKVLHVSDECEAFTGDWTLMPAVDAVLAGYTGCPVCGGEAYAFMAMTEDDVETEETVEPAEQTEVSPISAPEGLKSAAEATVYHSSNGRWYHAQPNCQSMRNADPDTLENAVKLGLMWCRHCEPPEPELLDTQVVWKDEGDVCHSSDACSAFQGRFKLVAFEDAVAEHMTGCPVCHTDAFLAAR